MRIYELKKLVEENFESEFRNYVGYLSVKEKFYPERNNKIALFLLFTVLIVIVILGILIDGITPIDLLIWYLIPKNIFMFLLNIFIIYRMITPIILLDFRERKLQHQFKKINFSSIDSLILKSNFNLEIMYDREKIIISIAGIKDIKRLVLILKKEFGEKLVIE